MGMFPSLWKFNKSPREHKKHKKSAKFEKLFPILMSYFLVSDDIFAKNIHILSTVYQIRYAILRGIFIRNGYIATYLVAKKA